MMTVRELIEALRALPEENKDCEVWMRTEVLVDRQKVAVLDCVETVAVDADGDVVVVGEQDSP